MHTTEAPPDIDRCGLCGGEGQPYRRKYGFEIRRCTRCGNAFVPRSVVPSNLEDLYSTAYFEGGHATGYPAYLADSALIEQNFRERLAYMESLGAAGRRLLDVGTAYGLFLKVARERGWDASGVEIAPDCAVEAAKKSGASVACGDFTTVPLAGAFDVVVMLDVIEHFRDPMTCLRRAHALLAPGGFLVIDTGDLDTPWAKLLGNRWYFLDPPQHLFYFSYAGLRARLRTAGFRDEILLTRPGRRVSATNIAFKLAAGIPEGMLRDGVRRAAVIGLPRSLFLNFGDGMVVAARRE